MSVLVLAVGALMLAAGGYEMVAGNSDILSERGWSAFIAGSVLVAGGVVTMAIGLAVRTLDRLRGAILQGRPEAAVVTSAQERIEPGPAPTADTVAQPDLAQNPVFEPLSGMPVQAAALVEHAVPDEAPTMADLNPPHVESRHESPAPSGIEHDRLDHSFAEFERQRLDTPKAFASIPPVHPEPLPVVERSAVTLPAAVPAPFSEPVLTHEEPEAAYMPAAVVADAAMEHDAVLHEAAIDHATVSAREEPVPAASPVIGRYESEGTSYVMYADGSIDAQSAAGVYRFASMAELKAFIES